MSVEELEEQVAALRRRPLMVICRTPSGRECVLSIRECADTKNAYIHVAADELNALLAAELGNKDSPN